MTEKITEPNVVIPKRSPEGDTITEIGLDHIPEFQMDFEMVSALLQKEKPAIKSIKIPNSVTVIGSYSFYGCSSLTKINIPNSVTTIGFEAFSGCVSLHSLKIPNSVTSIHSNAFLNCDKLLQEKNGVMFVDGWVVGCNSNAISVDISNARGVAIASFQDCSSLTSVVLPKKIKVIDNCVFQNCTGLTSVTIPDSVTNINYAAFQGCTGLTSVTIGKSVESIGDEAFGNCTGLTSITIPDSVTSIGYVAFGNCTGLTSITIPDSVTSIGPSAFKGCTALTDVYFTGTEQEWSAIGIGKGNDPLTTATIHYNYVPEK